MVRGGHGLAVKFRTSVQFVLVERVTILDSTRDVERTFVSTETPLNEPERLKKTIRMLRASKSRALRRMCSGESDVYLLTSALFRNGVVSYVPASLAVALGEEARESVARYAQEAATLGDSLPRFA